MTDAPYPPPHGGARSKQPLASRPPASFQKDYTKVRNRIPLDKINFSAKPLRRRYASVEDLSTSNRYSGVSPSYVLHSRRRDSAEDISYRRQEYRRRNEQLSDPVVEPPKTPDVPKIDFTIETLAREESAKIEPILAGRTLSPLVETGRSEDESSRNDSFRDVPNLLPDDTMSDLNDTYTAIMNFSSEADISDDKLDTRDGGDDKRDGRKFTKTSSGEYSSHRRRLRETGKLRAPMSSYKISDKPLNGVNDVKRVELHPDNTPGGLESLKDSPQVPNPSHNTHIQEYKEKNEDKRKHHESDKPIVSQEFPKDTHKLARQLFNTGTSEKDSGKLEDVKSVDITRNETLADPEMSDKVEKSPKHVTESTPEKQHNEKSDATTKNEIKQDASPRKYQKHADTRKSPKRQTLSPTNERKKLEDKNKADARSDLKIELGEILKKDLDTTKAKFLRIPRDMVSSEIIQAQMKHWDIALPHIILSVYGDISCWGTLLEAAESLGAWVMVDGTRNRACPTHKDSICDVQCERATCIGIADTSNIPTTGDGRKKGEQQSKLSAIIDQRPSHFLFIDGVSSENYYKTRSRMEHDIARTLCVPRVVLIRQTDDGETLSLLNVIHSAVRHNTPVLFTEKSSIVRDIIQFVIQFQEKNTSVKNTIDEEHTTWFPKKDVCNVLERVVVPEQLDRQIEHVQHCAEHKERFTFLSSDITKRIHMPKTLQLEIIEALLKGYKDKKKNLSYALHSLLSKCLLTIDRYVTERTSSMSAQRNREEDGGSSNGCQCCDNEEAIDNDIIIKSPTSWTKSATAAEEEGVKFAVSNLAVVLLGTLLSDDASCVRALLDGGVDLKNASIAAILYLYRDAGYTTLYEVEDDIRNLFGNILNRPLYKDAKEKVDCRDIVKRMRDGFHWLISEEQNKGYRLVTDFDIFIWSLLTNKINNTRLFWERGKDQMSWALMASHMLRRMNESGSEANSYCQLTMSKTFTNDACNILDRMYQSGPGKTKDILQEENESEPSPITVAADTSNRPFLSHVGCQSLLHETLCGSIHQNNSIITIIICVMCPLLIPWLIQFTLKGPQLDRSENTEIIRHKQRPRSCSLPGKINAFYSSPLVKFIIHMMFNTCLLLLYGYVLVYDMNGFNLSIREVILHVWVTTCILDNIRQIYVKSKERSLIGKLQYSCICIWNRLEMLGNILFCVGLPLRLVHSKETYEFGYILLCLNFVLYAVRISTLYFLHNGLGSKLLILEKMVKDLINFILMVVLVVFSFGIAILALLYKDRHKKWDLLSTDLISLPYIYLFEEFYPKHISGPTKQSNITQSIDYFVACRTHVALCLTVIYILICVLLLINLVASIFKRIKTAFNTEKLDDEWSYGPFHFHLVRDYVIKPPLPPPLCLLCYVYNIIHKVLSRGTQHRGSAFSKVPLSTRQMYLAAWQKKIVDGYLTKTETNSH